MHLAAGPCRRLRGEATVAAEDAGDGGGGWGALSELALKDCVELAPTPDGVLVAEADDVGLDLGWCAGGAGMGPSGTVGEGVRTPVAVASDPFVAGGADYAEAPAEASNVGVGMGGKEDDSLRRNMAVVVFQGMTDEASGVAQVSTKSSCTCLLCLPPIHVKEGKSRRPAGRGGRDWGDSSRVHNRKRRFRNAELPLQDPRFHPGTHCQQQIDMRKA